MIENDDRREEDDKDRKSNNGESELIAILTRTQLILQRFCR